MRKTEHVKVPAWPGNRDAGKTYKITEMSAVRGEKWATRALLLLRGSGERVPENLAGIGWERIAIVGINVFLQGSIKLEELEPLMDEMMTCIEIVRDPRAPDVATPLVSDDDIEEVQTRLWLRSEVLRLHTGFCPADALSSLISAVSMAKDSPST
jgi:hypothetical protein